ncbi:ClpP/crotonase-like domain-containing protein [Helicostylum pulchrum]|nr:ClpP/crotonase-like domain-containing protein [Helicostylum pulchrum]
MSQSTNKSLLLAQDRLNTQLSFLNGGSTQEPEILIKEEKNTGVITFNRPKQLNAFSLDMFTATLISLEAFESSGHVNMIHLQGKGRAFGSGVDIRDILQIVTDPLRKSEFDYRLPIAYNLIYFIGTMKTPVISFMDGITIGGTCCSSALSHFSIATENTRLSFPETRFGHFCDAGASFFLSRLNGNIGKYLALTSKPLSAEDVLFSGIATHFVPSNQLIALKNSLVNLDCPSKETINRTIEQFAVKPGHIATSYTLFGERRDIINRCFQFNTVAKILEALKKEGSKFSLETIDQISQGSPISVALTLENIRRGSSLSLEQCIRMEFKPWQIVPFEDDFRNGILSTIHKGKELRWSRKDCYAVNFEKDILGRYFNTEAKETLKLTSNNEDRYFTTQGRRFGLPTEGEVKRAKQGNNLDSDESIVAWFINQRNNKYGVREEVEEILARERKKNITSIIT